MTLRLSLILRIVVLALGLGATASACAQELNCQVTVNSDQVSGTNKSVFAGILFLLLSVLLS